MRRMQDRATLVGVIAVFSGVVTPVVTLVGMLFATAWIAALGMHPRRMIWGWLDHATHHPAVYGRHGQLIHSAYDAWSAKGWIALYYLAIFTFVLVWLALEGLYAGFFAPFARRLRGRPRVKTVVMPD